MGSGLEERHKVWMMGDGVRVGGEAVTVAEKSLMQQYREVKEHHKGALVLIRVGDFFELFGEDAEVGVRRVPCMPLGAGFVLQDCSGRATGLGRRQSSVPSGPPAV